MQIRVFLSSTPPSSSPTQLSGSTSFLSLVKKNTLIRDSHQSCQKYKIKYDKTKTTVSKLDTITQQEEKSS